MHIHYWIDVIIEEIHQTLHSVEFTARVTIAQRLHLEQHHHLYDVVRHTVAYATSVRHHQIYLKLGELVGIYGNVAKRTETSGNAIDRTSGLGYLLVKVFPAADDAIACIVAKLKFVTVIYYLTDTLDGEMFC